MAETRTRASARSARATLERETRLIREAIVMVARGGSPRVVVAGIGNGEALLDEARRMALEAGVRVKPIWREGLNGADISVEPIRE